MSDESLLQEQVRAVIRLRKLPMRRPDRISGGTGVGVVCIICGEPVYRFQVGYVVEYAHGAYRPDRYHAHFNCFAAWELACHHDGAPDS